MDEVDPRLARFSAAIPAGPHQDPPAGPPPDPVAAILKVLREGERFLVCSHSRPDGDAVASVLALGMLIRQMGKRADLVTADSIPAVYRSLPEADSIRTALQVHGPYDAAILLECDGLGRTRLRGLDRFFAINIDHHATGHAWANLNWIDRDAASVGELIYRLIKAAGAQVTPEIATCIYTTVLTDTGGFCYGPTRAATFGLAKELVEAGANPILIAQNVYFSMATSKLLLLGAALRNLQRQGRLSWLWVTQIDIARSCASEEDCEGIANFALSIAGVEAAVFLRELPDRHIRISLRSKGKVNVSAIAAQLGGGGHQNAAGCTLDGPLARAVDQILAVLRPHVAAVAGESAADLKTVPKSEPAGSFDSSAAPRVKPG
ncbi:MAG TPA: bifunctional oligoribonuclease/PAP phosphatase NrnA [Terracidiphilus sp.]|nr:bifunctional oligoribonuclease/PAP phosphatase NrnA [Terracidiphilus sp.]